MKIGIIPNINKENIDKIVSQLVSSLISYELEFLISNSFLGVKSQCCENLPDENFEEISLLGKKCGVIISIGGDGTLLNSAYDVRESDAPIVGLNFGKLGFLADNNLSEIDDLVKSIKNGDYSVEERMILTAVCNQSDDKEIIAINDIVIDKGPWPKMIEMTIKVDDSYVSTFSADGLIIATPTGSTGYSLSTGGPIITPQSNAVALSPISPHTLTMRPLVVSNEQKIEIHAESMHKVIQVNCDGQRVSRFESPVDFEIKKSNYSLKLLHTKNYDYFNVLRKKLFWGIDLRINGKNGDK